MEKRNYVKPLLNSEEFIPNEYVAACFKLGCSFEAANSYEEQIDNHPIYGHQSGYCGNKDNQYVEVDENGCIEKAYEKHILWGELTIDFYDETYTHKITGNVCVEDASGEPITLYWKTSNGDNVYHHRGTITRNAANKSANFS